MQSSDIDLDQVGTKLNARHPTSKISLTRDYRSELDPSVDAVDSILAHASRLTNVQAMLINAKGKVLLDSCATPIEIDSGVYLTVENTGKGDGDVTKTDIELMSNTLSASELLHHINIMIDRHRKDRSNAIGNKICYFEQKSTRSRMDIRPIPGQHPREARRQQVNMASPRLTFEMSNFYSNKSFDNLYGEQIEQIENRVKFFVNNKDWYDKRGIPYQLGMLYSNMSGCGKSSAIRAIANYTRRHIFNVNFSKILTLEQLNALFFNEDVEVQDGNKEVQILSIPIDKRLYVIEELDASGGGFDYSSVVYQRNQNGTDQSHIDGELTLADILLVLDGNRESPGRMVIMTANHPELLDEALVRPGRMDVVVSFTNASQRLMKEMFFGFFGEHAPDDIGMDDSSLVSLTAAEVSQVYFRHLPRADAAAVKTDLIATAVKKREAAEKSRKALEEYNERERKRAERMACVTPVDTIGVKPIEDAFTIRDTKNSATQIANQPTHPFVTTADLPDQLKRFLNG